VRLITESREASSQKDFLAVARKGRYLLTLRRRHSDDLRIVGVINLACFLHRGKMACLVFPTIPLSQSSAVVLWYDRQDKVI
jgi:hypothetical protein